MPPKNIILGQKITPDKLERAKELRRQPTQAERLLWQRLRANRLEGFHFRRQQVIAGYIVDFYCHTASLAVELDGEIHSAQAEYDGERDRVLSEYGIRVLRFGNQNIVDNLEEVVGTILKVCKERVIES